MHSSFRKVPDNRPPGQPGYRFPRSSRSLSQLIRPPNFTGLILNVPNLIETAVTPGTTLRKICFPLASAKVPLALASKSSKISCQVMLMSSLPRYSHAAARPQTNTTRDSEFFWVSVAAVLLLLSSFPSREDYKQDVEALVEFIHTNAGLDFDDKLHRVPLVAIPENGSKSESIVNQQA